MEKLIVFTSVLLSLMTTCFADNNITDSQKVSFPLTNWVSKNANDNVTIQNGGGLPIVILINLSNNSASVTLKNCGTASKIDAGSSAICTTNDSTNPVTITSDSPSTPAMGQYQIKQQ